MRNRKGEGTVSKEAGVWTKGFAQLSQVWLPVHSHRETPQILSPKNNKQSGEEPNWVTWLQGPTRAFLN